MDQLTLQSRGQQERGHYGKRCANKIIYHLQKSVEALAAPDRTVGQKKTPPTEVGEVYTE
jgi:hypothetical protein